MKYYIKLNYFLIVIALVVGAALVREIDFQQWTIQKPLLVLIYASVFLWSVISMIRKRKK